MSPASPAPQTPDHLALLRDGGSVAIRAIDAGDRVRLGALFGRLGPESVRHRYFATHKALTDADIQLTTTAEPMRYALAATARRGGDEVFLGIAHYVRLAPGGDVAEIAFEVADAEHERGIATLLLEDLAAHARAAGIATFRAVVEADNAAMLAVLGKSGFAMREWVDDGVCELDLDLAPSPHFLAAHDTRRRIAEARSVQPIFAPRSIAVVGASRTPGTIGRAILENLVRGKFAGELVPINPHASELAGLRCYPYVAAVGHPLDLAVIAVPAPAVEAVLEDCARAGVRAAVVITSGFAREDEVRLRGLARGAGMRLVGPNCMGVLSTAPNVAMNATFALHAPRAGGVSMATQSGALGIAMIDRARTADLGLADFASIGDTSDVSVNDLLAYWHDEARTRVIALYLESFGNPRAFARLAPVVARRKPIVAVKSGRSAAGTRAARSHSAALASIDVGIDALFAQTGVIRTDTLEQLFDVTALLANQPVPRGNRIGVVTNAGGPAILLADACEAHGLALPQPGNATLTRLREVLPAHATLTNPIDMIATAGPVHYERAIEILGADDGIDAIVAIYIPVTQTPATEFAAAIARGAGKLPPGKPIAAVIMDRGEPADARARLGQGPRGTIPTFDFPENAALALAAAARYGRWRARPAGEHLALSAAAVAQIRARVDAWCAAHPTGGWLDPESASALLALAGIPLVAQRRVALEDGFETAAIERVVAAAAELGYPVVVKAEAPGLVHKTEAGAVVVGLTDAAAVRAVAARMRARVPNLAAWLVQKQVPAGIEMLVGVTVDPTLGPLLVGGFGGTSVELDKDVAFRVTPVTDLDAEELVDSLRARARLAGFRGAPAGDRAAFVDVLRRVAALVEVVPELAELDCNPVILGPVGATVADARVLLAAVAK